MNPPVLSATRQQLALQSYLDDLLREATDELLAETAPVEPVAAPVVVVDSAPVASVSLDEFAAAVQEELARDAQREAPEPLPVAPAVSPRLPEPAPEPAPVALPSVAPPAVQEGNTPPPAPVEGPPAWAEAPFECLLFDVAGLTLAVPLVSLGSIYPLETDALTPLFGQPDWFLGLLPCQAGNLKVLDTARWLMPERYREDFRQGLSYVISVQGYDWGLAVHQVSRSIRLTPDEVKWRSQRTQRPWLAGTVIEHMCALLDVEALAGMITSGALKRADAKASSR